MASVDTTLVRSSDKLLSISRIATLVGSVLVALSSGTNYTYSAYAPQLGARLRISHTQLNIVSLAGNMGMRLSGPVWGRIIDRKGPYIPLIGASICFAIGYLGIKQTYDTGVGDDATLSALLFVSLVSCSFVTGVGSDAGINTVVKTTAQSFPHSVRATATGLVFAGFGLSAFWLTTLAYTLFPRNTSTFLLVLALGTAFPTLVGLLILRSVPLPPVTRAWDEAASEGYEPIPGEDAVRATLAASRSAPDAQVEADPALRLSNELGPNPVPPALNTADISSRRLWLTPDFYILFIIMGICNGTGLMYINNVGSISQALYAKTHAVYDGIEASKWQAAQVSVLSLGNFAGRIIIGFVSDFTHSRLRLPRAYCLCILSSLFIIAQATVIAISSVETLWIASLLSGFAYGSLFGSFPTIMIDWFGMAHFSENWGYLLLSSPIGANLFSLLFGHNLDTHVRANKQNFSLAIQAWSLVALGSRELPSEHQCFDGKACYLGSLQVTLVASIISLGLSGWAGIRDGQKARNRNVRVREQDAV